MSKICSKCENLKRTKEFSKNRRSKDGLQYWCKKCYKEYQIQRHIIKNNPWKLYRLVIDYQALNVDVQYEKMHYIGITKKNLSDRLNEHISAVRTRKTSRCYYWIDRVLKYIDLENIDLRQYIRIELVREYPSHISEKDVKKYEKKEVWIEGRKSWDEGLKKFGTHKPLFELINLEHFQGCKRCKDFSMKYDI